MEFVGNALVGLFLYWFYIICWHNLINKKIDFKNYKIYLFSFIFIIIGCLVGIIFPPFVKMILMVFILFFISYNLVFHRIKEALCSVLVVQLIVMVSEALFVLLLSLFQIDGVFLTKSIIGKTILNLGITLLAFSTMKFRIPNKLYILLIKSCDGLKGNKVFKYTLFMIIVASFFTTISYTKLSKEYILIINTSFVILYIIIMICLSKSQNKYEKISNKYSSSIKSLNEYENMIEKYKISNHESKAELNRILQMVSNNDPDTIKHIEAVLNTRIKENDKIMKMTSKIPSGGLRATIYSKMCIMEDKEINNQLLISKDVKVSALLSLNENVVLNICKVLGVFLDNAIEAVENLEKKDILIEIYKDSGNLLISITNNFKGSIDFKLMDKPGYTTKGRGHGYGLTLVHDVISSDPYLSTKRTINNDMITNTLIVRTK